MAMNISWKFEEASYNIIFVRAVKVKSHYILRWQRNGERESGSAGSAEFTKDGSELIVESLRKHNKK